MEGESTLDQDASHGNQTGLGSSQRQRLLDAQKIDGNIVEIEQEPDDKLLADDRKQSFPRLKILEAQILDSEFEQESEIASDMKPLTNDELSFSADEVQYCILQPVYFIVVKFSTNMTSCRLPRVIKLLCRILTKL